MDPARINRRAPEWQVWTALLIVYFVWGSTYLAISVVDETMPPLLAAGLRHLTAGTILFGLLLVTRKRARAAPVARRVAGRGLRGPGAAAGRQRPGRARLRRACPAA